MSIDTICRHPLHRISDEALDAMVLPGFCYTANDLHVRRIKTLALLAELKELDTMPSASMVPMVRIVHSQLLRDLGLVNMLFDRQRNVPGYEKYASYF